MLIGELAVAALIRGAAAHEAQVRQYDVGVASRKRHRSVRADFVRKHGADLLAALKPVLGSVKFRSLLSSAFDQPIDVFGEFAVEAPDEATAAPENPRLIPFQFNHNSTVFRVLRQLQWPRQGLLR